MAKRQKKTPTTSSSKPASQSEELAAKRAARRANRPGGGISTTRASTPSRPEVVQSNRKKREILTHENIAYQLAHPSKAVTSEDLQRDYAHVARDLRSMFFVAIFLTTLMLLLGQIL